MTAGIAVCGLGHATRRSPSVSREQLGKLVHVSNLYYNEQQILAAKAIVDRSFADRVFFCNSGAEANEGALKLARRYQASSPARRSARRSSRRSAASTAARSRPSRSPASRSIARASVRSSSRRAHRRTATSKRRRARSSRATACAIIVEPIQAEGGIIVPPPGYLAALRRLCDETGTILIFDEVQTGVGRTGKWFGYQHDDVTPDVMTLAKGLGGGVPIGAVAMSEKAAAGPRGVAGGAVPHASTFGGNPLACAAANAVFEHHRSGEAARSRDVDGRVPRRAAQASSSRSSPVTPSRSRGRGLLRGVAVSGTPAQVTARCREKGLLLSVAGDKVVRFAPPYIVERAQVDEASASCARCSPRALASEPARLSHARAISAVEQWPACSTAPRSSRRIADSRRRSPARPSRSCSKRRRRARACRSRSARSSSAVTPSC